MNAIITLTVEDGHDTSLSLEGTLIALQRVKNGKVVSQASIIIHNVVDNNDGVQGFQVVDPEDGESLTVLDS